MPHLLSVTGERTPLEPNSAYVMGRSLDCDIVVEDMAASRQHARIITGLGPDAILLEDLESRNGTYVNDEKVEGRVPLLDRARIRIGATFFLLRGEENLTATSTDATRLDTHTVGLENMSLGTDVDPNVLRVASAKGRAHTEIAGNLASFTMIDVLQLLVKTHRTGTLHIAAGGEHAQLHIQDGDILHASVSDARRHRSAAGAREVPRRDLLARRADAARAPDHPHLRCRAPLRALPRLRRVAHGLIAAYQRPHAAKPRTYSASKRFVVACAITQLSRSRRHA